MPEPKGQPQALGSSLLSQGKRQNMPEPKGQPQALGPGLAKGPRAVGHASAKGQPKALRAAEASEDETAEPPQKRPRRCTGGGSMHDEQQRNRLWSLLR